MNFGKILYKVYYRKVYYREVKEIFLKDKLNLIIILRKFCHARLSFCLYKSKLL